jgi:sialate O-acetylesterase
MLSAPNFFPPVLRACAAGLILAAISARADVRLPAIFGDHMVLQQETTLPVWGWAAKGEKVTVTFGSSTASATADDDGKWRVDLPALPAGTPPGKLVVAGTNTVTLDDVLIGDVWLCSGQSNMEFPLNSAFNSKEAVPQATDNQIRLFHVPETVAIGPRDDIHAAWEVCSPEAARTFTAVGYFFAKNLRPVLNRPIGLIESSFGGTAAQAWTDLATLKADPSLQHFAAEFDKAVAKYPGGDAEFIPKQAAYDAEAKKMLDDSKNDPVFQAKESEWKKEAAAATVAGTKPPMEPRPPQPPSLGVGIGKSLPTSLFDGMIAPLVPFSIKGVIWYQGENNTRFVDDATGYATLFPAMITDWRGLWKQGNFPFLFVQLANFSTPNFWPELRESQIKTLSLPQTGIAVIIDIGTGGNIHPPDKADVGYRLSLVARHVAYGENIVNSGPMYDAMKIEGSAVRISFKPDSIGGGLVIGKAPWTDPKAPPASTTDLTSFKVAGADKNWVDATAKIDGQTVVVSSPTVTTPMAVRYGWEPDPSCNLYNKEGLPASPFRTDDWPTIVAAPATPPSN